MIIEFGLGSVRIAYEASRATTPVFLLLGSPVAHSLSPRMQNAALQEAAIAGVYAAADVPAALLPAVVPDLRALADSGRLGGANVTSPLKQVILSHLDALSPTALLAGAVNTVVVERRPTGRTRLVGHNTDVGGVAGALAEREIGLRDAALVVTGTGGMARAAVAAALQGRARRVTLCARDLEGANSLVQEMLARWQGPLPQVATRALADAGGSLARADVLVQATSLGMEPEDPLPLDLETALPRLFVLDAVYGAGESALLSRARAHGLRVADGRCLLLHQGMAAFTLWTGVAAPIAAMRRAIAA